MYHSAVDMKWTHIITFVLHAFLTRCAIALDMPAMRKTTGHVAQFEIHLTAQNVDPVGAGPRQAILINGSFIGPTLHLNQGDQVEFLVRNYLQEDTSIHFHGIEQSATPWSDGVPGLTQEQIRSGASFLYRWNAEDAGTYFYHSHSKGQLMDGLYGAIVIAAPSTAPRPFHLITDDKEQQDSMHIAERHMQPLLVADWSQYQFKEFYRIETAANFDLACTDAIIFNGVGSQYCLDTPTLDNLTHPQILEMLKHMGENHMTDKGCIPPITFFQGDFDIDLTKLPPQAVRECVGGSNPTGNYTVKVDSEHGWAAFTFINPGGLYPLQISIDNHELIIYAVDGQYIYPTVADRILVSTGNRVSALVKLDQEPARYTIRAANDLLNQIISGFAEMAYDNSTNAPSTLRPKTDYAGKPVNDDIRSFGPRQSHPFPAVRPHKSADSTFKMVLRKPGRPYGSYEWSLSGHEVYNMTAEEASPLLFRNTSEISKGELVIKTKLGDWIDIVLITEGPFAQSHPMHKHGNKVFFLGSGYGDFPWSTVEEAEAALPVGTFNTVDPPYLDTFTTPDIVGEASSVWTVVRYQASSAGAWLFHCHVQTHLAGGMGVVFLDGVDNFPTVPVEYREWNGFEPPSV